MCDPEELLVRIAHNMHHGRWLIDFKFNQPYRKWRFTKFCATKMTIHQCCKVIAPHGFEKTLVGWEDWDNQVGFKGGLGAPVKTLRRALRALGVTVIRIDKYRTSKSCSTCSDLVPIPLDGVNDDGKRNVTNLKLPTFIPVNLTVDGVDRVDKTGKVQGPRNMVLRPCHQIVHCSRCNWTYHRDLNAAINILGCTYRLVDGKSRARQMAFTDAQRKAPIEGESLRGSN
jgi:hypothetical protein